MPQQSLRAGCPDGSWAAPRVFGQNAPFCPAIRYICVKELFDGLNPLGFEKGVFVILRGYMDEAKDPKTFNLTAVIATGHTWFYFEQDWLRVIEEKNRDLKAQGRKPISRYHATDCQFLWKDFEGWKPEERDEFCKNLFTIFEKYPMHVIGYSLDLGELVEEIPEAKPNPEGFAYIIALCFLMLEIGDFTLSKPAHRDDVISLIHDRCNYDSALLEMFNAMLVDPGFAYRQRFNTIAPMSWEHCVPLQSDLMAYENFKESQRLKYRRQDSQRRSLNAILDRGQMGGRLRGFDCETLRQLRERMNSMSPEHKDMLLTTARIKKSKCKEQEPH